MVCKLLKALYGLKQVPIHWYEWLSQFFLQKLELHRVNVDHSIFVIAANIKGLLVSIFVNDIKVMRVQKSGVIKQIKKKLATAFEIVDISPISFYLSLKVEKDREKKIFRLLQPAYIDKMLARYHLNQVKPSNTLMKEGTLIPNKAKKSSQTKQKHY